MMFPHSQEKLLPRIFRTFLQIGMRGVSSRISDESYHTTLVKIPKARTVIKALPVKASKSNDPLAKPRRMTKEARIRMAIDEAYAPVDPQSYVIFCEVCDAELDFEKKELIGGLSTIYRAKCTSGSCHFMLFETK